MEDPRRARGDRELVELAIDLTQRRDEIRPSALDGVGLEARVVRIAIEAERAEELAAPEAAVAERDRDALHPAAERGPVAQILESLERAHERVLHDVVGVGGPTEEAGHGVRHGAHVSTIQGLLGPAIASAGATDELGVVLPLRGRELGDGGGAEGLDHGDGGRSREPRRPAHEFVRRGVGAKV